MDKLEPFLNIVIYAILKEYGIESNLNYDYEDAIIVDPNKLYEFLQTDNFKKTMFTIIMSDIPDE